MESLRDNKKSIAVNKKKILITSARSLVCLDLARHLHQAGHEIYVTETHTIHFTRFSNAIKKCFVTPSPRFETRQFIDTLIEIAKKEKIDLIIPIFEEVIYISKAAHRFPKECELFCSPFDILHQLHNKWFFYQRLQKHGLPVPETVLIEKEEQLKSLKYPNPIILKPCYSRGSTSIKPLKPSAAPPTFTIDPTNPWIAQEWIEGKKYCSYSLCRAGKVMAHSVYPFLFTEDHYCLHFQAVDHPGILKWVQNIVALESFTGHIAFDFIERNGTIYAIECNPRATFGFNLFHQNDGIDKAFFSDLSEPILPQSGREKQFAMAMLMYGWRSIQEKRQLRTFFSKIFSSKDMTYDAKDLTPFLVQPLVYLAYIYRAFKHKKRIIDLYLFDIQWNGEPIEMGEEIL